MGKSATSVRISATLKKGFELDPQSTSRAESAGLILRVRDLLLREIDATLDDLDISHARQQVLAIICRSPGGMPIGEIARRAALHPATMTTTIDRLTRDGLIKRRSTARDRRITRVVATQKGQDLYEEARDALIRTEFGLADVERETIDRLNKALDIVAKALEDGRSPT